MDIRCGEFASLGKSRRLDNLRENVAFTQNLILFAVDFDVGTRILAVDNFVVDGDVHLSAGAVIQEATFASGDDDAALRLFFRAIGKKDTAGGFLFGVERFDDNTIFQRLEIKILFRGHVLSFQYIICKFNF